ncbi:putative quinol monooxygenase [Maritalea sp.]|jgi:quinol monooxygenase YgiN|uniref:putative quinol monooxygenase n=1 Tax=Maritalea sp. TaxID=2003361 RepID=UPI0039E32ED1
MYAVIVQFDILPDHFERFLPLMQQNARASVSLEPGCKQFDVLTDPSRPNEVALYEIYDSAAAFQAHLKSSHFLAFDRQIFDMVFGKSVKTYEQVL